MTPYSTLREANVARQAVWCPEQIPDLSFRGVELAGEVGEVCNVIKKIERERLGWRGSRDTLAHLAEELADVVICADLVANAAGIDLNTAIETKFNATSEKVDLPHRLTFAAQVPAWVDDFLNRRSKVEHALRAPMLAKSKGHEVPPPLSPEQMNDLANLLSVPTEFGSQ